MHGPAGRGEGESRGADVHPPREFPAFAVFGRAAHRLLMRWVDARWKARWNASAYANRPSPTFGTRAHRQTLHEKDPPCFDRRSRPSSPARSPSRLESAARARSPSPRPPARARTRRPRAAPRRGLPDQLTLTKKDGSCDTALYGRTMTVTSDDVCTVTQAPPGSCSATFTCSSKTPAATQTYAGNLTLTSTGTATGTATVTITNADGSPNCTGNYDVTISKQ